VTRRASPCRTSRRCCTAPPSPTNAILEGKGATVGLVTTKGFRQVLQIARSYVPGGLAGWIIWPKPEPLAALENTVEVDERIASDGTVIRELDDADVRAQLAKLTGSTRSPSH
jgi:N-methylhydantoinase A